MHKNRKIRSIRVTAFILSLASCLFLFSAGFSTWFKVVLPPGNTESGGSFQAYGVVDVIAPGAELNVSNFQYTSFEFVGANTNKISITYNFTSANQAVRIKLGYIDLSSYAGDGFNLFEKLITSKYTDGTEQKFNSITISFVDKSSNDEKQTSWDITDKLTDPTTTTTVGGSFTLSNTYIDASTGEISFIITPGTTSLEITYTFNVPRTEQSPGNFRQNLGKYLMAGGSDKMTYTKFISTVVAAQ